MKQVGVADPALGDRAIQRSPNVLVTDELGVHRGLPPLSLSGVHYSAELILDGRRRVKGWEGRGDREVLTLKSTKLIMKLEN